ncbi:MAG: copper chaperone [Adhaeribacter sp.]
MEILKFKTGINGESDIAKIKPFLDKNDAISKWGLDTNSEEKILSMSGENINPQQIENQLRGLGFTCEIIRVVGISGSEL